MGFRLGTGPKIWRGYGPCLWAQVRKYGRVNCNFLGTSSVCGLCPGFNSGVGPKSRQDVSPFSSCCWWGFARWQELDAFVFWRATQFDAKDSRCVLGGAGRCTTCDGCLFAGLRLVTGCQLIVDVIGFDKGYIQRIFTLYCFREMAGVEIRFYYRHFLDGIILLSISIRLKVLEYTRYVII